MLDLFRCEDGDGDELILRPSLGSTGDMMFHVDRGGARHSVRVDRDTVLSLIQALTEWAYPAHTPEGPNRSLIEELIAKAVKDQVAAVLPLHLSPVACTHGGFCRDANGVQVIQCPEPDPEPGDVGHPRPPAAEPACTCVHWVGWHGTRGCTTDGCECRSTGGVTEPSDVGHPRPPVESVSEECTRCNHRWGNHNPQGCQLSTCTCTKPRAAEDGPCGESMGAGQRLSEPHDTCGFIWALHKADPPQACSTSRAPLPIREKTVIIPECGLCKQPWSDGHGQPGDPCPGVEAARQHPGDWTDALWRVQPSAPASESIYCAACGHSWVSHWESLGRCVSTVGKGKCECTRSAP